jgi:hypothetical protein
VTGTGSKTLLACSVPIGYANPNLTDNSEIVGGSAYGAAAIAGGDGSRQPSEKELNVANYQVCSGSPLLFKRLLMRGLARANYGRASTLPTSSTPTSRVPLAPEKIGRHVLKSLD